MENFSKFCKEWEKEMSIVERDLYALLECISKGVMLKFDDYVYSITLLSRLQIKGYINRVGDSGKITDHGRKALKRGWVEIDIKEHKKQRVKQLTYSMAMLILTGIAAIASVASLFCR